ncbi:MAG: ATP-binding protein [Chitinispirillaceae bacterium]
MKEHSDFKSNEDVRGKIIGLGEQSFRKSYYPELQKRYEELERFQYLLDNTYDAIFVMNKPSGRISSANRAASRYLGYSNDELLSMTIYDITDKKTHKEIKGILEDSSGNVVFETYLKCRNGKRVPFEVAMHSTKLPQTAAVARNILDRRKAENALRRYSKKLVQSKETLEEAYSQLKGVDQMKSEFVSMASHELRTPLTAVLGYTQTLLAADLDINREDARHYLQIIEKETIRLKDLVSDLLDISKTESGERELVLAPVNLEGLVEDIHKNLEYGPEKSISTHSDDWGRIPIFCDKDKIRRVIINLMENAIRFGNRIEVSISGEPHMRTVRISDNGPGIAPKYQNLIFEKFFRIVEDEKPGSGSGLGLAIAKEMVQAHGGRIWVESTPGQGSTFLFTIKE